MNRLTRRSALLLPLGFVAGCSVFDDIAGASNKDPLPGKREVVAASQRGFVPDRSDRRPVVLPSPIANAEWPQPGGNATHALGSLASSGLNPAWSASIGTGGGYRRKITAQPVSAGGRVFTMDSDAVVSAFDLQTGERAWRVETKAEDDRSSNVGGGISTAGGNVFATTGRGEALALEAATGNIVWRSSLGTPARSAPTVADGRVFLSTIDGQLLALSAQTGERQWAYQATEATTTLLGQPAPAVSNGMVVAGFGSGDLVAVRAESGALAWADSLASARGRSSLIDLSAIRALPVIENDRVYAIGLGGIFIALDLRSGRRLWERDVGGGETPWLAGEWLFVKTTNQILAAIHRDDGHVRWTSQLPRYDNPAKQRDPIYWTGPVLAGNRLILAGSNEQAISVNPYRGRVLGTVPLSAVASVPPMVAAGTVFLVTDDATIQALR